MATDLTRLPTWRGKGVLNAVVESPRGCGAKLAWDPALGVFVCRRTLPLGLTYPYSWGFIPGTEAEDGDPVDVFVLTEVPVYPGVILPARLIAVLELDQKGEGRKRERNDRLIAVPVVEERLADSYAAVEDIPRRLRAEIEQFFLSTTFFTPKDARVIGWKGSAAAEKLVRGSERG